MPRAKLTDAIPEEEDHQSRPTGQVDYLGSP